MYWGEITPFHLLDVQKQRIFVFVMVFFSLFVSGIGGSCFHFVAPMFQQSCVGVSCSARIVLITRKAQSSQSKHIIGTQQCILITVSALLGFVNHTHSPIQVALCRENLNSSLQGKSLY